MRQSQPGRALCKWTPNFGHEIGFSQMVGGIANERESMARTRKSHPPSLKAKVAIEAVKGHCFSTRMGGLLSLVHSDCPTNDRRIGQCRDATRAPNQVRSGRWPSGHLLANPLHHLRTGNIPSKQWGPGLTDLSLSGAETLLDDGDRLERRPAWKTGVVVIDLTGAHQAEFIGDNHRVGGARQAGVAPQIDFGV
jgi:hypothetical protein